MKSKPRKAKLSATLSATLCSAVPPIHFHHHRHKPQNHRPGFGAKAEQEEVKIGSFDFLGTLRGSSVQAVSALESVCPVSRLFDAVELQLTEPSKLTKHQEDSIRKRCMNNSHPTAAPQAIDLVGTPTEQLNLLAFDDKDFLTSTRSLWSSGSLSTSKFHQHLY